MHTNSPENDDCFAIRQAARHISQLYERHLSEAALTPTQFSILAALRGAAPRTMLELAQAMVMDRTTLVRGLRPLLHNGLIADEPDGRGKRRRRLALTLAGEAKLAQATTYWRAAQNEFERKFGPRQAATLRCELFRLTREVSKV